MSSTERARDRAALERFFERELLPRARAPEWERSDPAPDAGCESYWVERDGEPMCPGDFELPFGDADAVAASLERWWSGTPLAGLGRKLVRLARRFSRREERAEVSSDVYEMF